MKTIHESEHCVIIQIRDDAVLRITRNQDNQYLMYVAMIDEHGELMPDGMQLETLDLRLLEWTNRMRQSGDLELLTNSKSQLVRTPPNKI
jgi:hypothetical protein